MSTLLVRDADDVVPLAIVISVVICAYTEERWSDLVDAVGSVQALGIHPCEIIVVIDHNPALLERVRANIQGVTAVENREQKGLSGARNTGAAVAHGTVVAFLDDDAVADPRWVASLAECYADPRVVGVGGRIEPLWLAERPAWFPSEFNWVVGCTYRGMPEQNAPVRNVIGANMSVRRHVLISAGGFRESFGCNHQSGATQVQLTGPKWLQHHAGDEETEFCIRVAQQFPDSTWLYTPQALVRHRVPAHRTSWRYFLWRCYDEGLGKAMLVAMHGAQSSLASERAYTLKTLPSGVARGLCDALVHRDPAGLSRAAAIAGGFASTAVGYLVGRGSTWLIPTPEMNVDVPWLSRRRSAEHRAPSWAAETAQPRSTGQVVRNGTMHTVSGSRSLEGERAVQHANAWLVALDPGSAVARTVAHTRAIMRGAGTAVKKRPDRQTMPVAEPPAPDFKPYLILELEISHPLPPIVALEAATGRRYEHALVLVRLHGQPLGLVELQLRQDAVPPDLYAPQIWHALQAAIASHLRRDQLAEPETLTATGVPSDTTPRCVREREAVLSNAPFVSVVVATHDRPDGLTSCLRSLLAMNYPRYEIIVVDNAPSTDAAVEVVRQAHTSTVPVRYVREDRPGLACAHNRGLEEVRGEIVAFTDDDVLVDRQWLAELVSGFSLAEHVGCVTGLIFPRELQTPSQLWIEQYGGFSKGFRPRVFDLDTHRPKNPLFPYAAGLYGSGANMAFRTAVLRRTGSFDPALGAGSVALGGDDLAAFFQIVAAGHALVYQPAAIVYHPHRRDYAGLRKQMYGYGASLTAYLTKVVVDRPSRIPDLLRKAPQGLVYGLGSRSGKNARKRPDYPRELTILERKGMLYGPLAYLRGRMQTRTATRRRSALPPVQVLSAPAALREEERANH